MPRRSGAGSRIIGATSTRRLFKRLPDTVTAEMVDVLQKSGPPAVALVQGRIRATTQRRTGKLFGGVQYKVYPKSLRLRVGFLGTPKGRAKLFYARILDLGRRAKTVRVSRRKVAGSPLIHGRRDAHPSYLLRVRGMKPRRFITGGLGQLKVIINRQLNGIWDRALKRASAGSND